MRHVALREERKADGHHRLYQDYGASVALDVSSRTLAVGSPLADYDKLGTDEPETYDTRPDKAGARARGKVYVYYSEPAVQVQMVQICSATKVPHYTFVGG